MIKCQGGEHDSTSFDVAILYKLLLKKIDILKLLAYYVVCDSAYAYRYFLRSPYHDTVHGPKENNFNAHQVTCCIYVECVFGEIN